MEAVPDPRIWRLDLDELDDDPSLLSAAERARADRFVKPVDARRYVQAHCGVRRILGAALGAAPERLEFFISDAGKPSLLPASCFDFSLSHSGPLALIATSNTRRVGVDIEIRRAMDDLDGVARLLMSAHELHVFQNAGSHERQGAFFDLWTRKEALLKATGRGFLVDPRTFELDVSDDVAVTMFDETRWTVARLDAGTSAAAAIAVENVASEAVSTNVFRYDGRA
jgi:4'-phosphopantetheinyl transferase